MRILEEVSGVPDDIKLDAEMEKQNVYYQDLIQGKVLRKLVGGRVELAKGGIPRALQAALKALKSKYGDDIIKSGDELESQSKSFDDFQTRNPDPNRQMTPDELEDFEMEIGPDQLEGYDFDGTIGDAKEILKEDKALMQAIQDSMFGKLDPEAGDKSPARKRFLEQKLADMEASGDSRLMTRDEIEELSTFDLGTQMDQDERN